MSHGSSGVDKLAWLKERGYVRDFEKLPFDPKLPVRFEVVYGDGTVHELRYREVLTLWAGVTAARVKHGVSDGDASLELECQECTLRFATIALADRHLEDDEECGMAQGYFAVVERRK